MESESQQTRITVQVPRDRTVVPWASMSHVCVDGKILVVRGIELRVDADGTEYLLLKIPLRYVNIELITDDLLTST